MLKWIVPVTKQDGVDRARFEEHWLRIHVPHIANLAQPLRYAVTLFDSAGSLGGGPPSDEMPYDGIAELTFRDFAHYQAAYGEDRAALRSLDGFSDLRTPTTDAFFTTEHVIVDGDAPADAVKWIGFVKGGAEVPQADLFAAWSDGHAPRVADSIARSNGACVRYAISHADQGTGSAWDGIASLWYTDAAAANAGLPPTAPGDPFPPLIDAAATIILQGREIVVIA